MCFAKLPIVDICSFFYHKQCTRRVCFPKKKNHFSLIIQKRNKTDTEKIEDFPRKKKTQMSRLFLIIRLTYIRNMWNPYKSCIRIARAKIHFENNSLNNLNEPTGACIFMFLCASLYITHMYTTHSIITLTYPLHNALLKLRRR